MNSDKKRLANRENARHSTGPRTTAGKSRVSRNAIRHGLTSITFAPSGSSERVTQIAQKLCETDPFPYRYGIALEIAEAQVFLDRIRLARAAIMENLQAIAAAVEVSAAEDLDRSADGEKNGVVGVGIAMTHEEFDALKRAVAEGQVRRIAQLIRAPTNRFKAFIKALSQGQLPPAHLMTKGPPFWTERPPPAQEDWGTLVGKALATAEAELASLARYERSALARKRRAIRQFDALRDE